MKRVSTKVVRDEETARIIYETFSKFANVVDNSDGLLLNVPGLERQRLSWKPEILGTMSHNQYTKIYAQMLLGSAEVAERLSAGSGEIVINILTRLALENAKRRMLGEPPKNTTSDVREHFCKLLQVLPSHTKRLSKKTLCDLLDNNFGTGHVRSILNCVVENTEINGRIHVSNKMHGNAIDEILVSSGYNFNVSPPDVMLSEIGHWKHSDVHVIVIDGIIERISEIHAILTQANETKVPVILVCRGLGEDVIPTLKLNFNRKTLNVIPVIVPFDPESVNIINDICVVSGCDVISALKGELISTKTLADAVVVDSVEFLGGKTVIRNSSTKSAVNVHLEHINDRMINVSNEQLKDILARRALSLSGNMCEIRITHLHGSERNEILRGLDLGVRTIKSSVERGIVDVKEILSDCECDIIASSILEGGQIQPSARVYAVAKTCVSFIENLSSTKSMIVMER